MNNTALVAAVTKPYVPGLIAMLNSFFNHNSFNGDIVIYKLENFDISLPWKNIKYIDLFKERYIDNNFKVSHCTFNQKYNVNSKLEIFKLKYNNIVYVDTDIIFKNSILEILSLTDGIYACKSSETHAKSMNNKNYIDAGLLVIGKKFLYNNIFNELQIFSTTKKWRDDEELINNFFANDISIIDKKYNVLSHEITSSNFNSACAIQYVGETKPWHGNSITQCFNEFTINEVIKNNNNGLLLLQKLKKLYDRYS